MIQINMNNNLILELTIEASSITKYYDGIIFNNPSVTYDGFINNDTILSLSGIINFSGSYQTAIQVGSYSIIPYGLTSTKYNIIYLNGILNIQPTVLNISINNYIKVYNGLTDIPNYLVNYSGLIPNEDFSNFTGSISISGSCLTAINTGTYTIIPYGLYSSNYNIIFINSKLTIIQASLLIIANNISKIYDRIPFYGGAGVIYDGFMNNDSSVDLLGTLTFTGSSQGALQTGNYVIIPEGLISFNYNITFISSTLTIYTNTFLIKALDFAKFYDSLFFSNPNILYTGDINDLSGYITFSGNYENGINVNSYEIYPSGFYSNNYNITYYNGTLYINPNEVFIIANNYNILYNAIPFDEISVTFQGLLGNDTSNNFSGTLLNVGTSLGAINIGIYNIIPSNLFSNNYSIIYKAGTLIINKSPLYIITQSFTKIYDGTTIINTPYLIIISISGIYNNELISLISCNVSFRNFNIGSQFIDISYITLSGITLNNYYLVPVPSVVGYILPKILVVSFSGGNKLFDNLQTVPKLFYSISGIIYSEQLSISSYFAKYRSIQPGYQIVDISYVILYGPTSNNYYLDPVLPITAFINSNNLIINWFGGSKIYDSYINSGLVTFTISGFYYNNYLTISNYYAYNYITISSYTATFNTPNTGLNIINITNIILTGPAAYLYLSPIAQQIYAYIYPVYLNINFFGGSKIYDATRHTSPLIYTISGIVANEIVTISSFVSLYKSSNVGYQIIDISFVLLYGSTSNNYKYYPIKSISSIIYKKSLTISFVGGNKIYDGTTLTSSTVGTLSGLMVAEYTYTNNINANLMTPNNPVNILGLYNIGPYFIDQSNNPLNIWYVYSNGITSNIYLDKSGNLIIDSKNFYNYVVGDILGPNSIYYTLSISEIITKPYLYQSSPIIDPYAYWIWSNNNLNNQFQARYNNTTNSFIYGTIYINANAITTVYFNGNLIGSTISLYITSIFPVLIYPGINIIVVEASSYSQNPGIIVVIKNNITNSILLDTSNNWVVSYNQPIIQYNYYSYAGILDQVSISSFYFSFQNPNTGLQLIDVSSIVLNGNALNNYYLISPPAFNAIIAKRDLKAIFSGGSKTYDSTYFCGPITFTLSGLINQNINNIFTLYYENVTISTFIPLFKSNQVGLQLIDISDIIIQGNTINNYNLLPTSSINANIYQRSLTCIFMGGNKIYDKTYLPGSISGILLGIVNNENINIISYTTLFNNYNVGLQRIDISFVTLSGPTLSNYRLLPISSIYGYIFNRIAYINFTGGNKIYDNTIQTGPINYFLTNNISSDNLPITILASYTSVNVGINIINITYANVDSNQSKDGLNYNFIYQQTISGIISQRSIIAKFITGNKTYDRTINVPNISGYLIGIIGSDNVTINSFLALYRNYTVGYNIVDISNVILGGLQGQNYIVNLNTVLSVNSYIYRLPVNAIFNASDKIYDSTNIPYNLNYYLNPIFSNDNIYINTYNASYTNINVGYRTININNVLLGGYDSYNYILLNVPAIYTNILPKPLTINFLGGDKIYDGTTQVTSNLTYTVSGIISPDYFNIYYGSAKFRYPYAGLETVDISNIYISGTNSSNYITNPPIPFNSIIYFKPITIFFYNINKIYDGTQNIIINTISYQINGLINSNNNVSINSFTGLYKKNTVGLVLVDISNIILYGNDLNNYVLQALSSFNGYIYNRLLTINFFNGNKMYDGTIIPGTITYQIINIINNDNITIGSYNSLFRNYNIGLQIIDISNITLSGFMAFNYYLNNQPPFLANIYSKNVFISFTGINKIYDNTINAYVNNPQFNGLTLTDISYITISSYISFYSDKFVQNTKTIYVTNIILQGYNSNNYVVSPSIITTYSNILPLQIYFISTGITKIYDQTTNATLSNVYLSGVFFDDISYISISSYIANYYDINFQYNKLINITNILLTGSYVFNYYINSTVTYGNILKKYVPTFFTGVSKNYDATSYATVINGSISNIIYPDIVLLSNYNSNFITPNVTINNLIIISDISFMGFSSNNYYTGLSYSSANITYPLNLNIILTASSIIYHDISNYLSISINPLWVQIPTQISTLLVGINNNKIISYDGYIFNFINNNLIPIYISNYNFTNFSIDSSNGIICGLSGIIITTNNGFNTFNTFNISNYTFNSVFLYNTGNAYIVGNNGIVFNSLDFGLTWILINVNSFTNLNNVFILSNNNIYIVGNNGLLLTTTNGGNTWNTNILSIYNLNYIFMIDQYNGYIVGNNGLILKTNNAGVTWITSPSLTRNNLNSITVLNINNVYIVGNNGTIIISVNRGLTWNFYTSGTNLNLTKIFVNSANYMYIIGDQGTILTYNYIIEGEVQIYDNTTLLLRTNITASNPIFNYYLNNLSVKLYSLNAKFYPTISNLYSSASSNIYQVNVKPIIYYLNPIINTNYDRNYIIYSSYPFVDQSGGFFNILDNIGNLVQLGLVNINSLTGIIQFNTRININNYSFIVNYTFNNISNKTIYNLTVNPNLNYSINTTTLIYGTSGNSIVPYYNQLNGIFSISGYYNISIDSINGIITFPNNIYINNYTLTITYKLNNTSVSTLYFITIIPYINYSINFISIDYNTSKSSIKPIVNLPGGTFNIYDISNYQLANILVNINTISGIISFNNSIPIGFFSFNIVYTFNNISNNTTYFLNKSPYLAYPEYYKVIQYDHTYYDASSLPIYIPYGGLFTINDISGSLISQNLVTINPYNGQLLFGTININSYIFMIIYTYNNAIKNIYYTLQIKPSIYYIVNKTTTLYNNTKSSLSPYINPLNGTFTITELDNVLVQLNLVNINYLTGIITFLQGINTGIYNFSIIYNLNNITNNTIYSLIVIPNIYYYNNNTTILYNNTSKSVNPNYSPLGGIFNISGFIYPNLVSINNTGVISFNIGINIGFYIFLVLYNSNNQYNYYNYNLTVQPIVRYDISSLIITYSKDKIYNSIIPLAIQPNGIFSISDNIYNFINIVPKYVYVDSSGIIYFYPYINIAVYNFTIFYTLNNITNFTNYKLTVISTIKYQVDNTILLYDRLTKYYIESPDIDQYGGIFTITGLTNYAFIDISLGIITLLPNINIGNYILTINYILRGSSNKTNYYITIQPNIYYTISSIITNYGYYNTSIIPYYIQLGGIFTIFDLSNSNIVQNGNVTINQVGILLFNNNINVGFYNLLINYSINNISNQTIFTYNVLPTVIYNISQLRLYYDNSGSSIGPTYFQLGGIFSINSNNIYIDPLRGIIYFNNNINVGTYVYTITYSLNYSSNFTKYTLLIYPTINYIDSNNKIFYERNIISTSLSPIYNQSGGLFIITDIIGMLVKNNQVFIDPSGGIITFNKNINVGAYSFAISYILNNLSNNTVYNLSVIPTIYYNVPISTINYFIQGYSNIPYYNQAFGNFTITDIIGNGVLTNFVSINGSNGILTFVKAINVGYYKFLITYILNSTFNTTTYELYVIPNINYPINNKILNYGTTALSVNPLFTQIGGTFTIYDLSNNTVQQNLVYIDVYTGIITFTNYINVGIYIFNVVYSLNNVSNNTYYYLYIYPTLFYISNYQRILYNRSNITSYPAIYQQNGGLFTINDISGTTLVNNKAITIDSSGFIYFINKINVGSYNFKISYLLNNLLVSTTYNLIIEPNLYYINTYNTLLYGKSFYSSAPQYDQSGGIFRFVDISGLLIKNNIISYDISKGLFYFITPNVGLYNIQIIYTLNLISNYINFVFYILPIIYYDNNNIIAIYSSTPSNNSYSLRPIVLQPGGIFSIQTYTTQIYIDISLGVITVPYNTFIGDYTLTILYSLNSVFNFTTYTINILPKIKYTINNLTIPYETSKTSDQAIYDPSGGIFTIILNDISSYTNYDIIYNSININSNNGIINFASSLFVGIYKLNIIYTINNKFNNTSFTCIVNPLLNYDYDYTLVNYRDISFTLAPTVNPKGGLFTATVPLINLLYTGISIDPNIGIIKFGLVNPGIWIITVIYNVNNTIITFNYKLLIVAEFYYTPPYLNIPVNTNITITKPYTKILNGIFSTSVSINGLIINSVTGVLQFNNILSGVYNIPITYSVFGTSTLIFYTLVVTPILIYTPNVLNMTYKNNGLSNIPYVLPPNGIFSAIFNDLELPNNITINSTSGIISVDNTINTGIYNLSVKYFINQTFFNVPFTIQVFPQFYYPIGNITINYYTLDYSEIPYTNPIGGTFLTNINFYVDISSGIIKFNNQINVGIYIIPINYTYYSLTVLQNYKLTVLPIYYYKVNFLEIIINNYGYSELPIAKQENGIFSFISVSGTLPIPYKVSYLLYDIYIGNGIVLNGYTGKITFGNYILVGSYDLVLSYTLYNLVGITTYKFIVKPYIYYTLTNIILDYNTSSITLPPVVDQSGGYFYFYNINELNKQTNNIIINNFTGIIIFNSGINVGLYKINVAYMISEIYNTILITLIVRPIYYYIISNSTIIGNTNNNNSVLPVVIQPGGYFNIVDINIFTNENVIINNNTGMITFNNIYTGVYNFIFSYNLNGSSITTTYTLTVLPFISYDINKITILYSNTGISQVPYIPYPGGLFSLVDVTSLGFKSSKVSIDLSSGQIFFGNYIDTGYYKIIIGYLYNNIINTFPYYLTVQSIFNYTISGVTLNYNHKTYISNIPNIYPVKGLFYFSDNSNNYPLSGVFLDRFLGTITVKYLQVGNYNIGINYYLKSFFTSNRFIISILPIFYYTISSTIIIYSTGYTYSGLPYTDPSGGIFTINYPISNNLLYNLTINSSTGELCFTNYTPVASYSFYIIYTYNTNITFSYYSLLIIPYFNYQESINYVFYNTYASSSIPKVNPLTGYFSINYININSLNYNGIVNTISDFYINYYTGLINIPDNLSIGDYNVNISYTYNYNSNVINYPIKVMPNVYYDISSQNIVYKSNGYSSSPININGGTFTIDNGYNNLGIFIDLSSGILKFNSNINVNKYTIIINYNILDIKQNTYYILYILPYISYDISNLIINYNTNYLSNLPILNPIGGNLTTNYGIINLSGKLFISNFYPNHYFINITYNFNNIYNTYNINLIVNSIFYYSNKTNNLYGIVNYSNYPYVNPNYGKFYLDISNIKILNDGIIIFDALQNIGKYILNVYYKFNDSITLFYYKYNIVPIINYSIGETSIIGGNNGISVIPYVSPMYGTFNASIKIDSSGVLYFTPDIIVGTYNLIVNYAFNDLSNNFVYNLIVTPYIFYQNGIFDYGINSQSEIPINNCFGGIFSLIFDLHQTLQISNFDIDISSGIIYFNNLINVNSYYFYVNYLVKGLTYTFTYNLLIIPVLSYLSYNIEHYSSLIAKPSFINPVGGLFSCDNLLDFIILNSQTGEIIIKDANIIGNFIFNINYTFNSISVIRKLNINVLPNIYYNILIKTFSYNGFSEEPFVSISGGIYNLISVKTQSTNIITNSLNGLTINLDTGIFYYNDSINVDNYILTVNYFINDVSGIINVNFIVKSDFYYILSSQLVYGTSSYSIIPFVNPEGGTFSLLNDYNNISINSINGIIFFNSKITVNSYNIIVNYLYNNVISTYNYELIVHIKIITVNFVANDKIYDGTTSVKFVSNKLVGVINNDKVYIDTYNANYQNQGPGLDIPILVTNILLDGPESYNYLLQYDNNTNGNIVLSSYNPNSFKINSSTIGNSIGPLVSRLFYNPSFILYSITKNVKINNILEVVQEVTVDGLTVNPYGIIQWDSTVPIGIYNIYVLAYNSTAEIIIYYQLEVTTLLYEGIISVTPPLIYNMSIESNTYQERYSSTNGISYVLNDTIQGLVGKFSITAYNIYNIRNVINFNTNINTSRFVILPISNSNTINHNLGSYYQFNFQLDNVDNSANLVAYELNDDGTINYSVGYKLIYLYNSWNVDLLYLSDFIILNLNVSTNSDPIFNPIEGTYYTTVLYQITIIALPNSIIYYTLDGTTPMINSLVYNQNIELEVGTTTIKAFAVTPGYANSNIVSATYLILKIPCLLSKTLIKTPYGNELVDNLNEGDLIITSDNRIVPIIKITKNKIENPDEEAYPICIPKDYFDINVPDKNTYISQGHAINLFDNYWIYGRHHLNYFNKYKIAPLYYHVLLPNYYTDNLIVNNLILESWSGNLIKNNFVKYQDKLILKINNKEYITYKKTCN